MMAFNPLGSDGWTAVTGPELAAFLAQQGKQLDRPLAPAAAEVHWRQLPWYKTHALVRITDKGIPGAPRPMWFLAAKGNFLKLDGLSEPILQVNDTAGITLAPETATDYLRFFCFFVHAEGLPFLIVDKMADLGLVRALDPATEALVRKELVAPRLAGREPDGSMVLEASLLFGDTLYWAKFLMAMNGDIEMIDDREVVAGLPTAIAGGDAVNAS